MMANPEMKLTHNNIVWAVKKKSVKIFTWCTFKTFDCCVFHAYLLDSLHTFTRSVPGNHKDVCYFVNGSLKFKDMFMLLNYICTEQSV